MPKFKIGDKVRILDGSSIENYIGGWAVLPVHSRLSMTDFVGEVYEVAQIDDDDYTRLGRVAYFFDGVPYQWDERGLELVEKRKFKEGDIVRFRQWDDMEAEFGTYGSFGSIDCCCGFTTDMKPLCGLRARLLSISDSVVKLKLLDEEPKEELEPLSFEGFSYSIDMIEPVEDSIDMIEPVEDEEIIDVEPEQLRLVTPEQGDIEELIEELGGLF